MNERVMQFRIGMFVIVAGLVLAMLLVWFGESPTLFREHRFLAVHYEQAPGVAEGIPVRKSGIRIGEVVAIQFDERPGQPDGVIVTLSLDGKYRIRDGSVPKITRGLIGDVWIDMLPGAGSEPMRLGLTPTAAMADIIEGIVAPDPSKALAAATDAFQNVKGTLEAIETAAKGISALSKKAESIDEFLLSFRDMGQRVGMLAQRLDAVVKENGDDIKPALASLRQVADGVNSTFDAETRENVKATVKQLAASSVRLDRMLSELGPLATDLGSGPNRTASTGMGQTVARLNRISYDLSILTQALTDGRGKLNPNGTIQKLLTQPELYNNVNSVTGGATRVVVLAEKVLTNLNRFAERIANDPAALGRGMLQR